MFNQLPQAPAQTMDGDSHIGLTEVQRRCSFGAACVVFPHHEDEIGIFYSPPQFRIWSNANLADVAMMIVWKQRSPAE